MDYVINENKPFILFFHQPHREVKSWKHDKLSPEMQDDGYHNLSSVKYFWARIILKSPQHIINSKVFVPKTNVKFYVRMTVHLW